MIRFSDDYSDDVVHDIACPVILVSRKFTSDGSDFSPSFRKPNEKHIELIFPPSNEHIFLPEICSTLHSRQVKLDNRSDFFWKIEQIYIKGT